MERTPTSANTEGEKVFHPSVSWNSGGMVETFLVSGSKLFVPHEQETITDWCRILVSECTSTPVPRQTAVRLLETMKLLPGEAWISASSRLVLHDNVRAASSVDHTKPDLSEDLLQWRLLSMEDLMKWYSSRCPTRKRHATRSKRVNWSSYEYSNRCTQQ